MSCYKIKCIRILYMVRGNAYFPKICKLSTCMPWEKSYWLICLENISNMYHNKFFTLGNRENLDLQSVGFARSCIMQGKVQEWLSNSDIGPQQVSIQRGRGSGPPPPGKSQIIWVSIGNKQLDPPPGKSWTLPPPPWKMLDPLRNLEKWQFSLKLTIWLRSNKLRTKKN